MSNILIAHIIYVMGTPRGNPSLEDVATLITALAGLASPGPADTTATTSTPVAPATERLMGPLR